MSKNQFPSRKLKKGIFCRSFICVRAILWVHVSVFVFIVCVVYGARERNKGRVQKLSEIIKEIENFNILITDCGS